MSDQLTEGPSATRRVTDTALLAIAIGAIAAWLWRRLRSVPAEAPSNLHADAPPVTDKVGDAVS